MTTELRVSHGASRAVALLFVLGCAAAGTAQEPTTAASSAPPPPQLVTAATRADAERLAALERPGTVLFRDDFESDATATRWFEIRGAKDGRAVRVDDPELAHGGHGVMRLDAPARDGGESGSGASAWLGAAGQPCVYFRRYIRFADDYDQGDLNHVGGGIAAIATDGKWDQMGRAGLRPDGDDRFTASFEPWRDWGRQAAPGYLFVYAYWMDMQRDRDGHYWGNMLAPDVADRVVPPRGQWVCLEHMVRANTIAADGTPQADGELAAWVDGRLYLHMTGIRWRKSARVLVKRVDIEIYVHRARRSNTVWYDDVVVSTGYVGPEPTPVPATEGVRKDGGQAPPESW